MDTTSEQLSNSLNGLVGLRKAERENGFNRVGNIFYNYLKEFNHIYFKRNLLKSFFSCEVKPTSQNVIISRIIKDLESNNRIAEKTILSQSKPFLRYRSLNSIDSGSYAVLMAKNGYKQIGFYNWVYDSVKKIPRKVLIKKLPLGVKPNFEFDFSELIGNKPRQNQGVYSRSVKSFVLTTSKNPNKVYLVL